jgi:hypothetical protein
MNSKTMAGIAIIAAITMLFIQSVNANGIPTYPESRRPKLDYFVMSFCPYSNMVEEGMLQQVHDSFGRDIRIRPHYVIYGSHWNPDNCMETRRGTFCSLWGIDELNQAAREVCVKNYYGLDTYYDFVTAINTNCNLNNVETCWEGVADSLDISTRRIERCERTSRMTRILSREQRYTNQFGVHASPTFFINGVQYEGPRTEADLTAALCSAIRGRLPEACN